jgi:hypothetical protein
LDGTIIYCQQEKTFFGPRSKQKKHEKRSLLEKQNGGHVKRFFWENKLEHVFGKTKMADLGITYFFNKMADMEF